MAGEGVAMRPRGSFRRARIVSRRVLRRWFWRPAEPLAPPPDRDQIMGLILWAILILIVIAGAS
jgi:hypothetical protein